MPTYETGHPVNVQNFGTLISRNQGFGNRYDPTNPLIKTAAMVAQKTAADTVMTNITIKKPAFVSTTNIKQTKFADMEKFTTKIINAFDATETITDKDVEDAKVFVRKIRGQRKSKLILNPSPDDPEQISASQQSYAQQLQHFQGLINFVKSFPVYDPNEVELKPAGLDAYYADLLLAFNNNVAATTPYMNALIARNEILYAENTGLVDVALESKKYTKSVPSITLPEFRLVSGIKFTRPKKKKTS